MNNLNDKKIAFLSQKLLVKSRKKSLNDILSLLTICWNIYVVIYEIVAWKKLRLELLRPEIRVKVFFFEVC
jgi:hypothetical protein